MESDGPTAEVTVDLDYPHPVDVLRSWSVLKRAGCDTIRGCLSSSGQGVHIKASGIGDPHPCYHTRRMAGDDPMRIAKDQEKPWRPAGVLFDSPYPWVDCPFNLIDQLLTQ